MCPLHGRKGNSMAGRYSKQELKDKLKRGALKLVATEGIERLSTRRLSAGCGLSDPYIYYQCYSDIPELLADTSTGLVTPIVVAGYSLRLSKTTASMTA